MSWPLRFCTEPGEQVGDCWYYPDWESNAEARRHFLEHQASQQYLDRWANTRPPIVVRFPPGFDASPDERYHGGPWRDNPTRQGWTVTGSIEDGTLTVTPSLNFIGVYHGFLTSGVLGDDGEGRRY